MSGTTNTVLLSKLEASESRLGGLTEEVQGMRREIAEMSTHLAHHSKSLEDGTGRMSRIDGTLAEHLIECGQSSAKLNASVEALQAKVEGNSKGLARVMWLLVSIGVGVSGILVERVLGVMG